MAPDPTATAAYGVRYKDGAVVPATNREQAERVAANLGGEVVTLPTTAAGSKPAPYPPHPFIFQGCPCKACGHYRSVRANGWRERRR